MAELSIEELLLNGHIAQTHKQRVQTELLNLGKFCPTLHPKLMSYIDNMGNESMLITLCGTIPMTCNGNTYYTPVNIFIPSQYPMKAPIAFVRPSANMIIRVDHPNVTRNGECTHQYLSRWDPTFNSLSGVVKTLSDDFSKASPLFSKPTNQNCSPSPQQFMPQPQPQQYLSPNASGYPNPSPSATPSSIPGGVRSNSPVIPINNANVGTGPYPYQPPQVPRGLTPRDQLSGKVRTRLARNYQPALELRKKLYDAEVELTRELAYLKNLEKTLPEMSKDMDDIKAACEKETATIDDELKEFKELQESGGTTRLAEAVTPVSGLSEQYITQCAKRDALEDVMYELLKRMNAENCDSVLRLIRNAASDQFICVALIDKIMKSSTTTPPPSAGPR